MDKEQIAKLAFQAFFLIDDKEIDHDWEVFRRPARRETKEDFLRMGEVLFDSLCTKPVPSIPQEPTNPLPVYPKAIKYTKLSDREIENVGQILWCPEHKEAFTNNCSECMLANNNPDTIYKAKQEIIAAYRPLLEQAEQRVKELEEENQQSGITIEALHVIIDQKDERINALESQLKPVSGWEETVLSEEELEPIYNKCVEDEHINNFANQVAKAQAELTWRKARQGMVELDENQELPSLEEYRAYLQELAKQTTPYPLQYAQNEETAITLMANLMLKAGFRKVKALASTEKGGTK